MESRQSTVVYLLLMNLLKDPCDEPLGEYKVEEILAAMSCLIRLIETWILRDPIDPNVPSASRTPQSLDGWMWTLWHFY